MKTKLKAFTLMELMIGMILSSILIGTCYYAYTITLKQFLKFKETKKEIVNTMFFNATFNTDLKSSELAIFSGDSLSLNFPDQNKIVYSFNDSSILRKSSIIDTFQLKHEMPTIEFVEDDQNTAPELVKKISMKITVLGQSEQLFFRKEYASETLLNYFSPISK